MVKAILFDLDGTLLDFLFMKKKASDSAARAMVRAGLRMKVSVAQRKLFAAYLLDIEGERVFQDFLRKEKAFSDKILGAGLNAYIKTKYKYLKPYPDVRKTLKALKKKGLKLGIVTDAPRLKAFMRLDEMKLADYFDVVVGFENTKKLKPSSAPFRKALKKLGVKASEALYVGDWPERDIVGAKRAGLKVAWARYSGEKPKKIRADYEIDKISELSIMV